jgi:hypothetical protein
MLTSRGSGTPVKGVPYWAGRVGVVVVVESGGGVGGGVTEWFLLQASRRIQNRDSRFIFIKLYCKTALYV